MVPVIAGRVGDDKLLQPLDTAPSNLARYDGPQRTTVVWSEVFAVHLVREHNASIRVHGPVEFDGCPVISVRL
jgi:hypothetical protein